MNLLGLLLAPLIYAYNLIFQPNNFLVKADITMESWSYYIEFDIRKEDKYILPKAFLQYLARYFFICDNRQDEPMKNILLFHLKAENFNFMNFMDNIEKMIYDTLNDNERSQLASLAKKGIVMPALPSSNKLNGNLAKYSFNLMSGSSGYYSLFFMSPGLDIEILSRTVAFMLTEIKEKVSSDEFKKMKMATIEFLEKVDDTSFKDRKYVVNLANEVIDHYFN